MKLSPHNRNVPLADVVVVREKPWEVKSSRATSTTLVRRAAAWRRRRAAS